LLLDIKMLTNKHDVSYEEKIGDIIYTVAKTQKDKNEVLDFFLEHFLRGRISNQLIDNSFL